MAHAEVVWVPERKRHPGVRYPDKYLWVFRAKNVCLYLDRPMIIDAGLRGQLNAFQGKNPNQGWVWFVQATRRITKQDLDLLTTHE